MYPIQVAKIAAGVHVALVAVAVYYVTQIWNYTPLSEMPSRDALAFSATALPPLVALLLGASLARNDRARWFLSIGLVAALAVYAVAFFLVSESDEPLAPLLLILTSLWQAGGLALLLLVVWLTGRSDR
jgi:hypothetical protein